MLQNVITGVEVVRGQVAQDWIDVNGHMNVANYLQAFDDAVVTMRKNIGITDDYVRQGRSTFAVECHMTYQQELCLGDPYLVTTQVLAYNQSGLHQFNRMYHAEDGFLAPAALPDFQRLEIPFFQELSSGFLACPIRRRCPL